MKLKLLTIKLLFLIALVGVFISCDDIEDNNEPQIVRVFSKGVPILVGPENDNSTFSFYNTSPESPDGKMISYVKILTPQENRYQSLSGELWVCNTNLLEHKKITNLENFISHNGVEAQWVDNNTIVYFEGGYIKAVNLDGQPVISPIQAFSIGHEPKGNKILYSKISEETNLYTILEYDISTNSHRIIADASSFSNIVDNFTIIGLRLINDWRIRHLKYSPDGSKIAFRIDLGEDEIDNHLITMNINGGGIAFFGPKPMHFAWYDNNSIMGHDNQIADGLPNDKSARRWTLSGEFIETLAGSGNHLSTTTNRSIIATESWYNSNPVVLRAYRRGQTKPFWLENVSVDAFTVWDMGNHVNPAFSRDGKRIYYHKSTSPRISQAYMVILPDN